MNVTQVEIRFPSFRCPDMWPWKRDKWKRIGLWYYKIEVLLWKL